MAKMGRPLTEIDKEQFEKLCAIQCTEEEICGWFHTTEDTLVRWCQREYGCTFAEAMKTLGAPGRISLRRIQLRLAESSAAMAIFLGKQMLGQKDYVERSGDDRVTIVNDVPRKGGGE